jgi:DNA helicase-2/ATP-dependent DNA helicase PcrA
MDLLHSLNPQQQQAVTASMGPVLVLAGPGSGKTRVLTHRIAYLIHERLVNPYNILAVTFTNKAAREMQNRVTSLIGERIQGLTLGTFHSVCARILRREADNLPFSSNFVIFDSDDQLGLVKRAIKDLGLNDKTYTPRSVHAAISNAKNELYLPDEFPVNTYKDEAIRRVYRQYQKMLLTNNALDFDDLLLWTAYLLSEFPEVREKYSRRYEHILVDEFQDTNTAQFLLLKHLASFHRNIFVVGDTDQSIYRWRGADYRNVLRFEEDYPDTQVILLEQNYRSTQAILDVAMAAIDPHPRRTQKKLHTDRGKGQKVLLYEAFDERAEAEFIVDTIASLTARGQAQPGDFAIMYRVNAQSRVLEETFLRKGLSYKLVGAQRFYGRREIKDMIAFLRLIHNPGDEVSLMRVINTPTRGIGDKTLIALRTYAQRIDLSPGELLLKLGVDDGSTYQEVFSTRALMMLSHFGSLLKNWVILKEELPPMAMIDRILEDTDYQSYINDGTDEGNDRWENLMELRRLAAEFETEGLESFLERIALVSDQDTLDTNAEVPTLLTLHAAKGLEFPIVMIVGLNEGILPHSRSFDDPEEMLEERRLLYVGITRAIDRLYLVLTQNRRTYGYLDPMLPSRFLDDIPPQLVDFIDGVGYGTRIAPHAESNNRWDTNSNLNGDGKPLPEKQYQTGMRVLHPTFGEGLVLGSELQNGDEIVDVFFKDIGQKKLAASFARLEIAPDP